MGHDYNEINVLVGPSMTAHLILDTACIEKYVKKTSLKAKTTNVMSSRPVAIANVMCEDHVLTIETTKAK